MKVLHVPGEFGWKALFLWQNVPGWQLSAGYYLTEQEVKEVAGEGPYKWPVEVLENGIVYVPDQSELS